MKSSRFPSPSNIPLSTVDTSGGRERHRAVPLATDRPTHRRGAAAALPRNGTSCTMFPQAQGREGTTGSSLLFLHRFQLQAALIGPCLATTPTYSAPTMLLTTPTTTRSTALSTSPLPRETHAAATMRRRSAHSGSFHRHPPFPTNDSSTPRMRLSQAK